MIKLFIILASILLSTTLFAQQKGYEGSILASFNGSINSNEGSYSLETIHGYRFNPHIFLGGGVGVGYANADYPKSDYQVVASTILAFKANFTKTRVSPFVMLKGGNIFSSGLYNGGFFAEPDLGIDINLGDSRKCAVVVFAGFQTKANSNNIKFNQETLARINSIRLGVGFRF